MNLKEEQQEKPASSEGLKAWLKGGHFSAGSSGRVSEASFDRGRVAVLPFSNISPEAGDAYFADGMTDEIISTLSKIHGLGVVSRTSIMGYRETTKSLHQIASELKVGYVLEGTVRKAGENLRITTKLLDAAKDEHVWSEDYDRKLENVLAIQSDIARNVGEALKVKLLASAPQKQRSTNSEAYSHYLKGRFYWNQRELDGFNKALIEFGKASEMDRGLAQAYAGLADTYLLLGRNGHMAPSFAYPKAISNAQKAIELDDKLPDPHIALAAIRQEYEWKWQESEREFKHALELSPSHAMGHSWYALYLGHVGKLDEALEETRLAQELDPFSPRIHCQASEELLFARQYDKAIEAAETALDVNPSFGGAFGYRGYAYVEQREYEKAISDFQEAAKFFGARAVMGRTGHACAMAGKKAEALKIVEELKRVRDAQPSANPFLPPRPDTALDLGLVCIGLGQNEQAISWLEKAADQRTAEIIHVKCEPIYDPLQSEPRFRALAKRIGLER